ncbi:MAG: hypothetical protein CMB82_01510 [Flammeovirgaceae bacterium]|nr:hypothetical protein [Flammeovirgaceae bacterium]
MLQVRKNTSKSSQKRDKNKGQSNHRNSSELAEFKDNRPEIISQRKLSSKIGHEGSKIIPFNPNEITKTNNNTPTQLKPKNNAAHPITQFKEAPTLEEEKEEKQNLNDIILKYQNLIDEAKNKLEKAYESKDSSNIEEAQGTLKKLKAESKEKKANEIKRLGKLDLDTADLAGEGIDSNKSIAIAWDPSLLEKNEDNEDDGGGDLAKKEEEKGKDDEIENVTEEVEKEKSDETTSFKFMLAGMEVEGEVDTSTYEGNATASGGPLGEVFELEGSVKRKDDKSGYAIDATTTIKDFETPEVKYSLPLARVPLGVPGVFAAVDMDLATSARLDGNFGISCETDTNFGNVQNITLNAVTVNAGAEASIGIFGGVSIGVPALGEVSVGGEGSAEASLNASANVTATSEGITLAGVLSGEAKGKLAAVAKAQILFMTKKKSIPIVEGVIGSFEKEITGTTITNNKSLEALTKFGPSNFKRNKKAEVPDKAADSFIEKPEENPKKASWLSRNMPSFFGRKK